MGRGGKDKARLLKKDEPERKSVKGSLGHLGDGGRQQTLQNSGANYPVIPPGVPECDIVLKGSKRFWYLELILFLFGIGGFLVSALLLIRIYFFSENKGDEDEGQNVYGK